ncbi:potassium transporter Kup [Acidisoma cellulosilyticum]|uniref:potassium transporter Kup n=1 Tax=Acidisoma cellulosilyticum TaxID=2802395 RepID=UPI0029CAB597|nr:KUP/HAK/KT family potassium transporter [Acidisoma cellulosilyticum]
MDRNPADRPLKAIGALTALGIVYGDLGTSPLYTYQTIVADAGGHPSARVALGLLSLVIWALIVTVSVKYCVFVMRADNSGEGGILALMSLVTKRVGGERSKTTAALVAMGLFGAALIYGDGIITPSISVLSALEGVNVVTTSLQPYVLPAALAILVILFVAQRWGTARIGRLFGPIMLVWFAVIGLLGLMAVIRHPGVLAAIDPTYAIGFLVRHGARSLFVLGGVFLAITGGEALYADMGHIGRAPIRAAWSFIVLPALLLSYAGQTALIISDPGLSGNPFFRLAPGWAIIPLVVLATFATIIASQAIITGAFSLTRQAIQLGWLPGVIIRQTSDEEYGQIYVPSVNWLMMVATLALTWGFGSSAKLAGAYGTAVSTTMLLTTALLFNAMLDVWRWPLWVAASVSGVFLLVDLGFFTANLLKIAEGGWIPLVLGAAIFIAMRTWRRGIQAMRARIDEEEKAPNQLMADLAAGRVTRVPGTAVFLSRTDTAVPIMLTRHVAQMGALQERVVTLTLVFEEVPRVAVADRAQVEQIGPDFWHVRVHFGFVEVPNAMVALASARANGCPIDLDQAVFFAARDHVVRGATSHRLPAWRRAIFSVMYRNAVRSSDRFDLPADRFLEVGRQVEL